MSAYVEIIFDNSDDRFPTNNKEVILRRTITPEDLAPRPRGVAHA